MPCSFKAPNKNPCPAHADVRSPHGYCFAHEEIYIHDAAITFRRKARKDVGSAERWALGLGLSVDRLKQLAETMARAERPIALEVQ